MKLNNCTIPVYTSCLHTIITSVKSFPEHDYQLVINNFSLSERRWQHGIFFFEKFGKVFRVIKTYLIGDFRNC